jgi:hypothetical protein
LLVLIGELVDVAIEAVQLGVVDLRLGGFFSAGELVEESRGTA